MKRMSAVWWGYSFTCEQDIRTFGRGDLQMVIDTVFAFFKGAKPVPRKQDVRDDEQACEYTAYKERQSRWFCDARKHVKSPWFWMRLDLNYHAKLLWQH